MKLHPTAVAPRVLLFHPSHVRMWAHISPRISNESRLFAFVTELAAPGPSTLSSLFNLFILILLGLGSVPSARGWWRELLVLIIPSLPTAGTRSDPRTNWEGGST
jgi:hypothetical protein